MQAIQDRWRAGRLRLIQTANADGEPAADGTSFLISWSLQWRRAWGPSPGAHL